MWMYLESKQLNIIHPPNIYFIPAILFFHILHISQNSESFCDVNGQKMYIIRFEFSVILNRHEMWVNQYVEYYIILFEVKIFSYSASCGSAQMSTCKNLSVDNLQLGLCFPRWCISLTYEWKIYCDQLLSINFPFSYFQHWLQIIVQIYTINRSLLYVFLNDFIEKCRRTANQLMIMLWNNSILEYYILPWLMT